MLLHQPPHLLTYPARPIQGGRLELAPPKRGEWIAEPKVNGWRAVVHTPSGTMWNRHGSRLTIEHCFKDALDDLRGLSDEGLIWPIVKPSNAGTAWHEAR